MSDISFDCPNCRGHLVVDARGAGCRVPCPQCNAVIVIPRESETKEATDAAVPAPDAPAPASVKNCTRCGRKLADQEAILATCRTMGIPLTWSNGGPAIRIDGGLINGVSEICDVLRRQSEDRLMSFEHVIADWAPYEQCPTCGERWCERCINGPLPYEHLSPPAHCKCR